MVEDQGSLEASFETSFETGPQRAVRMDVIPAGRARRSWSCEAKTRIVAASFAPGANVAKIARANDIIPQQLYRWRHLCRKTDSMGFVPVVVDQAGGPAPVGLAGEIVIRTGAISIHVPGSVTAEHIKRVIAAARQLA